MPVNTIISLTLSLAIFSIQAICQSEDVFMIMFSKIHEISPEASVMYLKNCAEESENSNLVIAES